MEADVELKRFVLANQVQNAYKKIADSAKPFVLDLLRAPNRPTLYRTFAKTDQAEAPVVITAGTQLKVVLSAKTTRRFRRPSEVPEAKLSPKQLLAITVFDGKLIDAAVTAGVITAAQAVQVSLDPDISEFPLVQPVK